MYRLKRSTVNMYKIDRSRSVRVKSMGYCWFSNVRFNSRGNVPGGEGNCPRGGLSGGNMSEGEMSSTLLRVTCMTQKL